jgi:general secretion pathway protein J
MTLRSPTGGFTLLELLLSITLIALVIVIIIGALRLSTRSVESGEQKAEALERFRTSLSLIDAQIQSQAPLSYEEDAQQKYFFEGGKNSMQFASNYSLWGGQRGYVIVSYDVEADSAGKFFLRLSENTIGIEESRTTTLFDGCDILSFEYFYKAPAEEEGEWVDEWTDNATVPEKVRLTLKKGVLSTALVIPFRSMPAAPPGGQPAPSTFPTIRQPGKR